MFKDIGYENLILEGTATRGTPYKSNEVPDGHHQPKGSKTESVPYYLDAKKITICHQYTLPDGKLGASEKPDPKMIEYLDQRLYCHSNIKGSPCPCETCSAPPEDWKEVFESLRSASIKP